MVRTRFVVAPFRMGVKITGVALASLLSITLISGCISVSPRDSHSTEGSIHTAPPAAGFDSLLAARLGADTYGMKQYVMAFLKKGPNRSQDSARAAELQEAHLRNITRLAEEGKLVLAGPFLDEDDIRGIYIFNVRSIDEARRLTGTDPAIREGRLVMELHPWYGSAALQEVNRIHERLRRRTITDE